MAVRNEADELDATVASVRSQLGGSGPIAIAVGPSDDGTLDVALRLAAHDPELVVVENPAGWVSHGLNRALAATDSEIVIRVDGHCRLPEDYAAVAVDALDRSGADVVGGVQHAVGTGTTGRAIAVAMTSKLGVGNAKFHYGGRDGATDTVYLGVFRRAAIERAGGFDESLLRNQDYELNWRIRDTGGLVWFTPDLSVDYRPRSSLTALAGQYRGYGTWKRVVLRRHPESLRLRQLAAPILVLGSPASLALAVWTESPWWTLPTLGYLAMVGAGGILAARREPAAVRVRVPAALMTMHWSWGLGFLFGRPVPPPVNP